MTFESLYIKSFGKLKGKKINFSDGINIIEGANESGKSTVCAFIQFMFFGLPAKTADKLRYISWDTSLASGSIVIKDKGLRYRIEREVVCSTTEDGKYLFREKCGIYDAETNMICFKSQSPGEVFFGVSSSVFESTAYIRQTANSQLETSALGDEAENILFSGNERINTNQALSKLDGARVFLLHKNKKGGKIFDLEEKRNLIDERLKTAQNCESDIISLEGSHRVLTERSEHIKKRTQELQNELSEYERYCVKKSYLFRKSEKEKLAQEDEQLRMLKNPIEHENIAIAEPAFIDMLDQKQSELSLAASRLNDSRKELKESVDKIKKMGDKLSIFANLGAEDAEQRDMLVQNIETAQTKMEHCKLIAMILGLCSVFSIILTLIFRNIPAIPDLIKYLSVTTCLLFATAAAYVIFMKKHDYAIEIENICHQFNCGGYEEFKELIKASSENEAYMNILQGIRDEKKSKMNALAEELDALSANVIALLQDANFRIFENAPVSLTKAIEKCRETQSKIQALEVSMAEHRANIENTENKLFEYSKDYLKEAYHAQYDEQAMEDFPLREKKQELNTLTEKLGTYTNRLHQIEVELSALRAVSTDPTAIAEEIAILENEIDELTNKWSAYMLAIEALNSASGKLREGISPKIAKNASKLFSAMTEGKYDSIGLDTDFALSFSDGNMMRDAACLSAGTSDLAYICLRMALIELLYKRSVPPFLFDESFARMDDGRMEKVLTLIHKYAQRNYQSILFTCHSREKTAMQTIGAHQIVTL